jgi:putative ABC transport system substrate-binding protein
VPNRRTFVGACAAGATMLAARVYAQPAKVVRVGVVSLRTPDRAHEMNVPLFQGLRERGYVEGRNLEIDFPDARGHEERLPALAAELVRRKVDLILVVGPAAMAPAFQATKTIPIVMVGAASIPSAKASPRRSRVRAEMSRVSRMPSPIASRSSSSS